MHLESKSTTVHTKFTIFNQYGSPFQGSTNKEETQFIKKIKSQTQRHPNIVHQFQINDYIDTIHQITLTSPNFCPQASRFPQKTQESHKHGPSLPLHMVLQALQHCSEELNLNSEPHFTAFPQSSKFSIPLQHPPLSPSTPPPSSPNPKDSNSETEEVRPGLSTTERNV